MTTFSTAYGSSDIGDTGMVPRGIPVNGYAPHKNGAIHMQGPPPAGHNSGTLGFDAVVQENLKRGIYRSQRDAMMAVARDPRCTRRHILVHAVVIYFMNSTTAMAFPGWRAIAEMMGTFPGDIPDPDGAYSESSVNNLLSDLRRWGYLPSDRRGPEGGGRAIAHYTIARPSPEQLREEITKFIVESRALDEKARKRLADLPRGGEVADLPTSGEVRPASDLPRGEEVSSDLPRGRAADLPRGRVTVTSKEEPEENPPLPPKGGVGAGVSDLLGDIPVKAKRQRKAKAEATAAEIEEALAAYNEAAEMHGFTCCRTLTDTRRKRLGTQLHEIGGVAAFKLALSAIPRNDFLMGKVRPRNGGAPFKLDIDRLLSTESGMGDVLAKLIDAAGNGHDDASVETEVQEIANSETGHLIIGHKGREAAMREFREIRATVATCRSGHWRRRATPSRRRRASARATMGAISCTGTSPASAAAKTS